MPVFSAPAAGGRRTTASGSKKKKEDLVKGLVTSRGIRYGYACEKGLVELTHTTRGDLRGTGEIIENTENHRDVVRWAGKVVGIAESFFPHPEEWRFDGLDLPLDKIDVRSYTQFLMLRERVEPTCLSAWELPPNPFPLTTRIVQYAAGVVCGAVARCRSGGVLSASRY